MKTVKNIVTSGMLFLALALGIQSCDLDEYNPSGTTADVLLVSPEGMATFVNRLYYNYPWKYFGREDPVLYLESSTDIWVPRGGGANTYGDAMTMYKNHTPGIGQFLTVWNRQYDNINRTNAIINRIGAINYGSQTALKEFHEGQARWFRAYAYWWLCEFFGDVELRTEETSTAVFTAERTGVKTIYDEVILPDLRLAVKQLPVSAAALNEEYGRHTKKAAYGMLARCALTRASYETDASAAAEFYREAYEASTYVIDHKADLGISLYANYEDLWKANNNKTNTEFLAVVTHSGVSSYNAQSGNPNRLFQYFSPKLQSHMGIRASATNWGFHQEQGNSSAAQMPTRFFLELFEEGDMRYDILFQEKFYAPTNQNYSFDWDSQISKITVVEYQKLAEPRPKIRKEIQIPVNGLSEDGYEIESGDLAIFGKDFDKIEAANGGNTALAPGEQIYWFPRTSVDKSEIESSAVAIVDIDMRYNADGSVRTAAQNGNAWLTQCTPRFRKFRITDTPIPAAGDAVLATSANGNVGFADVSLMRFAEMQMIAAEAAMYLNSDNKGADFINDMRERIVRPGSEAEMTVSASDMNIDFILDERARELAGEWLRWFDLHRTGKLYERVKAYNPEAGTNIQPEYNLRPIPQGFLNSISNSAEFGQNPGYAL